ncbi:hypothetical protein ON010_g16190 [Phytophthora cinnamomi]|nr:hypothetical protein ON010_g16190 [Phytophthora cinnamomi]
MYLDGEEILSDECENEPLDGSFSGYYGQQSAQQSSGLSRGRHGSAVAGVPGAGEPEGPGRSGLAGHLEFPGRVGNPGEGVAPERPHAGGQAGR